MQSNSNENVLLVSDTSAQSVPATISGTSEPVILVSIPDAIAAETSAEPIVAEQPVKAKSAKRKNAKPSAEIVALAKSAVAANADTIAELSNEARELLRKFYTGASAAIHARHPRKRDEYAARVLSPVQRIANNSPTSRDDSALALLFSESANKTRAFHPEKIGGTGADLGCVSRLASAGFIAYASESDTFTVTLSGAKRGRALIAKAA